MKTILNFMLLMVVAVNLASASDAVRSRKKSAPKDKKMKVVDVAEESKKEVKAEAPCDTNAKELMKKLEDEQKKKAAKGQAFSLQGNNASGGCTIGN